MPLLMAVFLVFGACGPYLVVPATAALLVWAVFVWARQTIGSTGALLAAVVVTVTPVVLWQAILPMSDVPAGAAWTGAAVLSLSRTRRGALVAGCATAMGLLIRPNLLPLAAVPLAGMMMQRQGAGRWRDAAIFCAPVAAAKMSLRR